ncbi:hypothetical protein ACO0K7_10600 [Undibacterium sp. Ji67W]|uniref:hypothetical protein n=1 Tax=Undibacterium sp. Ji67W TaxID=3413042 RepID=UPI003BEF56B7
MKKHILFKKYTKKTCKALISLALQGFLLCVSCRYGAKAGIEPARTLLTKRRILIPMQYLFISSSWISF